MTSPRRLSRLGPGSAWAPVEGGVTTPQGYLASGVSSGLKKNGLDLALVFSSVPAKGSAVFTLNQVVAAPIIVSRRNLKRSRGNVRAIILAKFLQPGFAETENIGVVFLEFRFDSFLLQEKQRKPERQ